MCMLTAWKASIDQRPTLGENAAGAHSAVVSGLAFAGLVGRGFAWAIGGAGQLAFEFLIMLEEPPEIVTMPL